MKSELPGTQSDVTGVYAALEGLGGKADTFLALERAMRAMSDRMPARASFRQGIAFAFVAYAHAAGRNVTMTDLRERFESLENNVGTNAQSLSKSFALFFDAEEQEGGLGWVRQEIDRKDKRKKYLHLTPLGVEVADDIISYFLDIKNHNDPVLDQDKT